MTFIGATARGKVYSHGRRQAACTQDGKQTEKISAIVGASRARDEILEEFEKVALLQRLAPT